MVLFQLPFVRERRARSRGAARETGGGERASEIDRTRVRNSLGTIVCAVGSSVEFHRRYAPRRLMLRLRKRETGYLNSGSPRLACRVSWRTVQPPMEPPLVHDRVNGVNSENPWLVHHRPTPPPLQRDDWFTGNVVREKRERFIDRSVRSFVRFAGFELRGTFDAPRE